MLGDVVRPPNYFFSQSYVQLKYDLIKTMAEALAVRALVFKTTDFSGMLTSELYQLREETNEMIKKYGQDLDSFSRRYLEEGILEVNEVLGERTLLFWGLKETIAVIKKMMKEMFPVGESSELARLKAFVLQNCSAIGRLRLDDNNKGEVEKMRQFADDIRANLPRLIAEKLARFNRKARERIADRNYVEWWRIEMDYGDLLRNASDVASQSDIDEARLILDEIRELRKEADLAPGWGKKNWGCPNYLHWQHDVCESCSARPQKK